jgi:hypothetical protein
LRQETQAMDIRPVGICPLVWWVQISEFGFQPPCLCETQSRWTDVGDLCRIQGPLNQHGYHNILQQYTIPSGLCLVGL